MEQAQISSYEDEEFEIVELDGSTYRINSYVWMETKGTYWAKAEKKVNGEWFEVRNWGLRAKLGQFRGGGSK